MLVLSRRTSEHVQIGEGITVRILKIEGDRVRLGIVAPAGVRVVRGELLEAVADENVRAAQVRGSADTIAGLRQAMLLSMEARGAADRSPPPIGRVSTRAGGQVGERSS